MTTENMPSRPPTRRALEVRDLIIYHLKRHGMPPSIRELADLAGISGPAGIHEHLKRLEAHNLVVKLGTYNRCWTIPGWSVSELLERIEGLEAAGGVLAARVRVSVESCGHRPPGADRCEDGCECCGDDVGALSVWSEAMGDEPW